MADIGNSTVYIGSPDWYIGDAETYALSVAQLTPEIAQFGLLSTARVEAAGVNSDDPIPDVLTYEWELTRRPPRSAARIRTTDGSVALLEVDAVGAFGLRLTVYGANSGATNSVVSIILGQPATVAYSGGISHDTAWVWNTLPDSWRELALADRVKAEAFWSALQSLVAADMLAAFNARDALSISSIQAETLRKWYEVPLSLDLSAADVLLPRYVQRIEHTDAGTLVYPARITAPTPGTLLSSTRVKLTGESAQLLDSNRIVRISANNRSYSVRVQGVEVVNGASVLSVERVSVGDITYPAPCSVTYDLLPNTGALIFVTEEGPQLGQQRGDAYILEGVQVTNVTLPTQIRYSDAEMRGVSVGDEVTWRTIDNVTGRAYNASFNVVGALGDIIAIDAPTLLQDALENLRGSLEDTYLLPLLSSTTEPVWVSRHTMAWLAGSTLAFLPGTPSATYISLVPETAYMRTRAAIDDDVTSIFRLQSTINRFMYEGDELLYPDGTRRARERPLELIENVDFYLRRAQDVGYGLTTGDFLDVLTTDRYDFLLAGVTPGERLTITDTAAIGTYTVVSVGRQVVRLDPPPPTRILNATFTLESDNAYIIFQDNVLSDRKLDRLWAEYVTTSNDAQVESSFGALVGLNAEAWRSRNLQNSYRDAVAALLKARVTASTLASIEQITSLIVGVPMSPTRGIIQSINHAYELTEQGEPSKLRITLEEIDAEGRLTGRLSAKTAQAENSGRLEEFSGLKVSSATGRRLSVGDIIEQFTPISEGVRVVDLYTNDTSLTLDDVVDRHRFGVLIDADATRGLATTLDNLSFLEQFIDDVKPSYTDFLLRMHKYVVDDVLVESDVFFSLTTTLYDNPYHHRGPANILDDSLPLSSRRDEGVTHILTSWLPRGTFVQEGAQWRLTSDTGGFLDPSPHIKPQLAYAPWIREGDFVRIRNTPNPVIHVDKILSDTEMLVSVTPALDLLQRDLDNVAFYVYRPVRDAVAYAADVFADDRVNLTAFTGLTDNVGVGDQISVQTAGTSSGLLRVIRTERDPITGIGYLETYPRIVTDGGEAEVRIYREQVIGRETNQHAIGVVEHAGTIFGLTLSQNAHHLGIEPGTRVTADVYSGYVTAVRGPHVFLSERVTFSSDLLSNEFTFTRGNPTVGDPLDEHELAISTNMAVIVDADVELGSSGRIVSRHFPLRPGDIVYLADYEDVNLGEGGGVLRATVVLGQTAYTNLSPTADIFAIGPARAVILRQAQLQTDYLISTQEDTLYSDTMWGREHWQLRSHT